MVIRVGDIETLKPAFLYHDVDFESGVGRVFRMDRYRNDLTDLVNYLSSDNIDRFCFFNGLNFDAQVLQHILDNWMWWGELDGEEIARRIYQFAQDTIHDVNYGTFPPYPEWKLWKDQIDPYRIHHYDNEARRCGLKWLEYSMDLDDIEEMPIDHSIEYLSEEDIEKIEKYCKNDVKALREFLKITFGDTQNEEYKGKNKIKERLDVAKQFGIKRAMNFSDVKIGDELNKIGYAREKGIEIKDIYNLKLQRQRTKRFTFGDCVPKYVQFETPELNDFYRKVSGEWVDLNSDDQKFELEFKGTTYTIAKGGIHSGEGKRILQPRVDQILRDADVSSQYPNAIVKRGLYPSHLGPEWLVNYKDTIKLRLHYKKLSEDETLSEDESLMYASLAAMLKLALNGGGFGKTNERSNWQYDPFVHFSCTIGNQFEMLMLIEKLELNGIHVVSANTDGIVSLFDKDKELKYKEICEWWEKKVGNDVDGRLEFTDFKRLIQTSVNIYLAVKTNGKTKKKGKIFLTSHELHKNKSRRIIPIALEEYFMNGTPIEDTIKNHDNIFDFCIGVKSSKKYHYEAVDPVSGDIDKHHTIVRYFVSNKGRVLLKVKNDDAEATGNKQTHCERGGWLTTVYNIAKDKDVKDLDINYDYYIEKTREIIQSIEKPRVKKIKEDPNQLTLF